MKIVEVPAATPSLAAEFPAVAVAEVARDEARATFDAVDSVWQSAVAAERRAQAGNVTAATRRLLAQASAEAAERREAAWDAVIAANQMLHAATVAARAELDHRAS